MSFTKCHDETCPVKSSCYRWTARTDNDAEYFERPRKPDGACELYLSEVAFETLLNAVKEQHGITDGLKPTDE